MVSCRRRVLPPRRAIAAALALTCLIRANRYKCLVVCLRASTQLKYDSVHGTWDAEVEVEGDAIAVTPKGGAKFLVTYSTSKDPKEARCASCYYLLPSVLPMLAPLAAATPLLSSVVSSRPQCWPVKRCAPARRSAGSRGVQIVLACTVQVPGCSDPACHPRRSAGATAACRSCWTAPASS